jgi:hypothetical protein
VLQASRWESLVWPRWLPVRARLAIVAQITGAVALTALLVGPWWSRQASPPPPPQSPAVAQAAPPRSDAVPEPPVAPAPPLRPAHVNLDVRHGFARVELSITVDGRPTLSKTLEGSGKRFKVFGKRGERNFTQTLDLDPGVRILRVRARAGKFDQTRTVRLDLGSAAVATLRIAADSSGLSLAAEHPPAPARTPASPKPAAIQPALPTPALVASHASTPPPPPATATPRTPPPDKPSIELILKLRSMLIAIAGIVASAATGALVQEFLKRRRGLPLADAGMPSALAMDGGRPRRRAGFQNDSHA